MTGGRHLSPELQQLLSVAGWFLIVTFLQLALYPALKKTFGRYAYPAAFAASLLLFTLISWYCGLARLPVQLALLPFAVLFLWNAISRQYTPANLREQWQWELVFAIFFFLMLEVRYVNPTISYAEKFMDHAFLASVMRQPVIPPLDPWFAGGTLNVYYYLGYWMFGCLGVVTGVPSNIAFNLVLPTVLGVSAVTLYAIGDLLLERFRWLPVLVLLLPNPAMVHQLVFGTVVNPAYDPSLAWLGTRTIANTINEYPLFSFVWGDVHPHVISMFNQLLLIFILAYAWKEWGSLTREGKAILCGIAAVSLGSMPLINTWDVLVYAPLTVVAGALVLLKHRPAELRRDAALLLVLLPVISVAMYLPFYIQLEAHTNSFGLVGAVRDSDPVHFLYVHGFFLIIITAALSREIARRPYLLLVPLGIGLAGYESAAIAAIPLVYIVAKKDPDIAEILAIFGLLVVIACEFVFIKDYMGDVNFRMNTVFKWYIAAWFLLGISATLTAGRFLAASRLIPLFSKAKAALLCVLAVVILFAAPFSFSPPAVSGGYTLDGLAYLSDYHPGDAAAVAYLRSLPGNEVIVEAEGAPYTYYSRISSFTGLPAIIGWSNHEGGWRSDIASRTSDICSIYEDPGQARALMQKYNATLVVVGDTERARYRVNLSSGDLALVFSQDETDIYRLA